MKLSSTWCALILIASALLVTGVRNAEAQESPHPSPTLAPTEQPDLHATAAAEKERQGNVPTRSFIRNPERANPQSNGETTGNGPQPSDEALTRFTGALVIVGIIQALILWFTVVVSRASVRAYVVVRCENVQGLTVGDRPRVVIVFKNFGNSPAYHLRYRAQLSFAKYPMPNDFKLPELRGKDSVEMTISQNVEYGNPVIASKPLTTEHFTEIIAHQGQMFVYGKVKYKTLGMRRYTEFAFFILQGQFPIIAPVGNNAN